MSEELWSDWPSYRQRKEEEEAARREKVDAVLRALACAVDLLDGPACCDVCEHFEPDCILGGCPLFGDGVEELTQQGDDT